MSKKQPKVPYKDGLDKITLARYNQKIDVLGFDPYELKDGLKSDYESLPPVTYIDIINYLVNSKSAYTMEQLKAVKSLDAYNQFVNGWVRDVQNKSVNNKILVIGRVRHSQRMNEKALKPWFIASPDGSVDYAHCDCMAGLGEACSHVGALLFFVDQANRINASKTVTQEKAYWLMPNSIDKVPYSEVGEIDFTSASSQKRKLDSEVCGNSVVKKSSTKLPTVPESTEDEMNSFYEKLFTSKAKCAILSIKKDYQEHFIPEILKEGNLPSTLINLKSDENLAMSPEKLKDRCEQIFSEMEVTEEQARNAEHLTRNQATCKEWHSLRTGRITSSNMKAVCSTTLEKPAKSTINSVCGNSRFSNKATQWGCRHENTALLEYTAQYKNQHINVSFEKCGLHINPKYPHLGASPDGLIKCDCCGEGVVEVKCPYCVKDKTIAESEKDIEYLKDGKLKETHRYYYQIQTQLLVTEKEFCDFVIWTPKELFVQRLEYNPELGEKMIEKATAFFVQVVLPELTGNLVSRGLNGGNNSAESVLKQIENTPKSNTASENTPKSNTVSGGNNSAESVLKRIENTPKSNTASENTPKSNTASENTPKSNTAPENTPKSNTASVEKKSEVLSQCADNGVNENKMLQKTDENLETRNDDCEIICLCQSPYDELGEDVIGCDDEHCPYVWLHFSCAGVKKAPRGKYYCPHCSKSKKKKTKRIVKHVTK